MEQTFRVSERQPCLDSHSTSNSADATSRQPVVATAVGASYAFDPGVDGLASIYAARVLERGIDPRALCAEIRADRLGLVDRGPQRRALMARTRPPRFGRGTAAHLQSQALENELSRSTVTTSDERRDRATRSRPGFRFGMSRKLAAAGIAALLLLPLGVIVAHAHASTLQSHYVVQPGDMLNSVAVEFGVDPAAILATSGIENPPSLTHEEIIVIPDPSESSGDAARSAN
jgi:LysM repeat protein